MLNHIRGELQFECEVGAVGARELGRGRLLYVQVVMVGWFGTYCWFHPHHRQEDSKQHGHQHGRQRHSEFCCGTNHHFQKQNPFKWKQKLLKTVQGSGVGTEEFRSRSQK